MITPDELPKFPLFVDPVREKSFEPSDEECDICGRCRGWIYALRPGSPSPEKDGHRVCPWCIHDGSAAATGLWFAEAEIYPIHAPQLSEADAALVSQRTPKFVTWQQMGWRMCCDRACVYLGEAHVEDLRGRWAGALPELLKTADWTVSDAEELLANMQPKGSICAYVFRCQVCAKLCGYWDCD